MAARNSLTQKTTTRINLKKVLLFSGIIAGSMTAIYFILVALGFFGVSASGTAQYTPGSGPVATGYTWSKQLTVDHAKVVGSNDLNDFPMLIHITDPDLKHVSYGGKVESVDGFDIAFTGAGSSLLEHQIESYDASDGELFAWIKMPVLFASVDTKFDMVYGAQGIAVDPSTDSVWHSGYTSVWHMNNDPGSSNLIDAAGINDGVPNGMDSSNSVSGVIGPAIEFDGVNERFALENIHFSTPDCIDGLTVTAWVNTTHTSSGRSANWSILDFDRSEYFNAYVHGNGKAGFSSKGSTGGVDDMYAGNFGQANDGNWHHVAMVYDGTSKHVYIDGVLVGTNSAPHNGSKIGRGVKTRYGFIGDGSEASSFNGNRNNKHFEGMLDEIHFLEVDLSGDWIATEYNNQISPETFVTIEGASNPLPIELISFEAWLTENGVQTEWLVASQINNDYFTVERSADGNTFEAIGTVQGAGNSSVTTKYRFIDPSPLSGVSYYRLKQTDFNGDSETFDPIIIEIEKNIQNETEINVYPNPFEDNFTVEFELLQPADVRIQLFDMQGVQVYTDMIQGEIGYNTYNFYQQVELIEGMYVLTVTSLGEVLGSSKIIKK